MGTEYIYFHGEKGPSGMKALNWQMAVSHIKIELQLLER